MTVLASPIDLDALQSAAGVLAFQFGALGEVEARVLGPQERSGQFDGGVAFSVRTGGAAPGLVGLVAGTDAAATVLGEGDVLERWEPAMAEIIIALSAHAGDLAPGNVELLAPGARSSALDPEAISIGFFLGDQLLAAIGFIAERPAERQAEPAAASQVFQPLAGGEFETVQVRRMHLLHDVEMGVSVELGRTRMTVRELLALSPGAIVELNKAAGAPVDLLVNGTLMARGEVVVVDEEFAIRISEIVTPELTDRRGASDRRGA
jgi:flagellar motor switch protein FliN/FliY